MDIATVIGLVGGTVLILIAIFIGGQATIFFNAPGLLIVIGGTISASFIKFTMADVINSITVAMKAFLVKIEPSEEIMKNMVALAKVAKQEGLIALEKEKPKDAFSSRSVSPASPKNSREWTVEIRGE